MSSEKKAEEAEDIFGHLPDYQASNNFGFDGSLEQDETSHLHVHWDKPAPASSVSEPAISYSQTIIHDRTGSGIEYYQIEDEAYAFENSILNSTCKKIAHYWLANPKLAGLTPEKIVEFGPDLLDGFPNDIRAKNSLHLVSFIDEVSRKYIFDLVNADAAAALASNNPPKQIVEQLKFIKAWFLNGRNLEFHLKTGTQDLAEKLLGDFSSVMVFDQGQPGRFRLFPTPRRSIDWQDLGLPFAPIENS